MQEERDVVVVGAGLAGSVVARCLAEAGRQVAVLERRSGPGGLASDALDAGGRRVHCFGPHVFHSNDEQVVAFLSRFTAWQPYVHRVLARVGERLLPFPINRCTINQLYGLDLDADGVARFLAARRQAHAPPANAAEVALDAVGPELYDTFYRAYSRKQWGVEATCLPPEVIARIPVRYDDDDRYFTDRFQGLPAIGYQGLCRCLLDHPGITCRWQQSYQAAQHRRLGRHMVWTGALDELCDQVYGRLPYRRVRFAISHHEDPAARQPAAVINEAGADVAHTRTTDCSWFSPPDCTGTVLVQEFPGDDGEPCYPMPWAEGATLARRYRALVAGRDDVSCVGRLAEYRYYNMDQVVAVALTTASRLVQGMA